MSDLSRTPTLAEVIRAGALGLLAERPSVIVARVESYDPATQRANVLPCVRQWYGDGSGEEGAGEWRDLSATLVSVPVIMPSWGQWVIHAPLAAGDYVVLLVSTRSIDEWLEAGGVGVEPADARVSMLDDAIALPGIWPAPEALGEDVARAGELVLSARDASVQVRLTADEVIVDAPTVRLGSPSAAASLARADLVFAELGKIATATSSLTPYAPPLNADLIAAVKVKGE